MIFAWTLIKFVLPPAFAGGVLIGSLSGDDLSKVVNMAALAVVFAGFFVLSKTRAERDAYKAQVNVHESAADAWREERDASVARAERYQTEHLAVLEQMRVLQAELTDLAARPDLTWVVEKLELLVSRTDSIAQRTDSIAARMSRMDERITEKEIA